MPKRQSLPKPTAFLVDLDGTLMRHKNERLIAELERLDTLIHILTKPFKKSPNIPTEMDLTVNVESNPVIHRIIHGIRTIRGIGVDQIVEPAPGAVEFLRACKALHLPIGLVSNGYGRSYGKPVLRHYGLREYFVSLIFRENVRHGKPNPESLLRAVYRLGLDPKKKQVIWFLGDQAKDMKAAMEAMEQMPEGWTLVPLAFGEASSTARLYLSGKRDKFKADITNHNFVRNFSQLQNKLKNLL